VEAGGRISKVISSCWVRMPPFPPILLDFFEAYENGYY
jgi:hypothetical protein